MAQGSGFFISADGYIVTNNHVVDHATEVTVTTDGGKTIDGQGDRRPTRRPISRCSKAEGSDFPVRHISPPNRRASAIG